MNPTPMYEALRTLTTDQFLVIWSIYWGELTETAIAEALTEARGTPITRNWVHRRHLTALDRIRRVLDPLVVAA